MSYFTTVFLSGKEEESSLEKLIDGKFLGFLMNYPDVIISQNFQGFIS